MSEVFDCTTPEGLTAGVEAAAAAVREGKVVVLPTDTVYGIGCDAFSADAVAAVLAAKGRGREMPPPVLVPNLRTVDGLARDLPDYARALIRAFWPGALTLVVTSQPSLAWDLGETNGTVGIRMPNDATALALLVAIGPMAVTSANLSGRPAATTVADAQEQLGASVAVYLDAGPLGQSAGPALPSTILDCTGSEPVTLREGALARATIDEALAEAARVAEEERVAAAEREVEEAAAEQRAALAALRTGKGVGRPTRKTPPAAGPRSGHVAGRRREP
ncbi:MAG: L-threonylcarbamoyladenylate synthase [Lapillicoccus sp.]